VRLDGRTGSRDACRTARRWLSAAAAVVAVLGAIRAGAEIVPLTRAQRRELSELRKVALGSDEARAREAFEQLKAMGKPAQGSLFAVARELLNRGRSAVITANRRLPDPEKVRVLEAELDDLRAAARETIRRLDKGEKMREAKENYARLTEIREGLAQVYAMRLAVVEAMARRDELLAIYRAYAPASDRLFPEEGEAALVGQAEQAVGMTVEEVRALPEFDGGKGPAGNDARHLWFYRACRRIEAYNAWLEPRCHPAEWENIRLVNEYRESLGIWPYEVDARLLQSARRHSKEMVDLDFFSHTSPTAENKSHTQRMKNTGYGKPYSENIAWGHSSGRSVFWAWFESPPHHQNMVDPGNVHLGVGKWRTKWTQNMGREKRLMLRPEADRAKAAVKGEVLPPEGMAAARVSLDRAVGR
jgi:hypothetical protein